MAYTYLLNSILPHSVTAPIEAPESHPERRKPRIAPGTLESPQWRAHESQATKENRGLRNPTRGRRQILQEDGEGGTLAQSDSEGDSKAISRAPPVRETLRLQVRTRLPFAGVWLLACEQY